MTNVSAQPHAPVVHMSAITVDFASVTALSDVDFRLLPGEVHALMGENGAGKSTLIKTLTGVHRPTSGRIHLHGEPVEFTTPAQSQEAGVSTVYQEVNLCPNLSVAENILLGREPRRMGPSTPGPAAPGRKDCSNASVCRSNRVRCWASPHRRATTGPSPGRWRWRHGC